MYTLTVRDHFMIAHSFSGERFGPARNLHGATYVVDATFRRAELDADDLVVDIGLASEVLAAILAQYNYNNLDEIAAFQGRNTTTEFLAGIIQRQLVEAARSNGLGPDSERLDSIRVSLGESHVAWASFEGPL
ncbi:MAG: 6-carboxytetrahydropterin synthase [Wenzhouxiangellaceae bacterium]|nr:6-carboxytetrahydropterin synthase [Wenzhouxiangellaceae bacterium]MBS3745802.1 6-carboxytetrahydropterin synthase [Wenzhouxiangellaceae bacterium]MBS3824755.1 6-carboxytetrahydropterin synthase [Wenzhouxiangellaceae bacterium]